MSLKAAKEALLQKNYTEAIALLLEYGEGHPDPHSKDYVQAQMWLVSAYQRTGRADRAIPICEQLQEGDDPKMVEWAESSLLNLRLQLESAPAIAANSNQTEVVKSRPNRYRKANVTLALSGMRKLKYVLSIFTSISLQVAISAIFFFWLVSNLNPTLIMTPGWINVAWGLTAGFNFLLFFMSPWIVDVTQAQFLKLQWITLGDLEPYSDEAVEIVEQFCQKYQRDIPQIALVEDPNPIAYTYGILPNSARLVISRGLLTALDRDEIAAVIAHQLAQISNWSFTVATFTSAPSQVIYAFQVWCSRLSLRLKRGKFALAIVARVAQFFYALAQYSVFCTSRSGSYLSDRFAASITGNPNAMSRALTKIARGIVTVNPFGRSESRLLQASRTMAICDYQTVIPAGMAFEILYNGQESEFQTNLYRVFLWEMFNPWAKWVAFQSSHPLVGDRLAALTNYTKQLGLTCEYEYDQLVKAGEGLNQKRLYKTFTADLLVQTAPYSLALVGYIVSQYFSWLYDNWLPFSLVGIGAGLGVMLRGSFRYPNYNRVAGTNLASLLVDPYASALRGQPVQIPGEIIGYSSNDGAIASINYGIKLADRSGLIYLDYLPNLKSLWSEPNGTVRKLETLVGESVVVTGWFRRNQIAAIDLSELKPMSVSLKSSLKTIPSYHQLWNNLVSSFLFISGLTLLLVSG
jgi:Zn-dependent protease with chaperone function